MSRELPAAHAELVAEGERVLARLGPRDADVAVLLRAALVDVVEYARTAAACDAARAARLWERCATSEEAVADAVREARRRRRLDSREHDRIQGAARAARRSRNAALVALARCRAAA